MSHAIAMPSWNIQTALPYLTGFTMANELIALAEQHDDIVVLTADLALSNGLSAFQDRFPKRFFNMGIAEQNMISVAAGLAASGYRPYISTFAAFVSLLGAEQLRTDLAYPGMKVTILAHHVGVALGFYGTSHHAVEDIAVCRAMGGMTVASAADGTAIRGLLRATLDTPGPVYLRIGRGQEEVVYDDVPAFVPGRFHQLRDGNAATVIATGIGVHAALEAAIALDAEGVSVRVLDAAFIKPLDTNAILAAARETGAILTVEEHNPNGGLGEAVAGVLADSGLGIRFRRKTLPDDYAPVAPPTHLYRHFGLDGPGVTAELRKLIGQ
jgi:transketolase